MKTQQSTSAKAPRNVKHPQNASLRWDLDSFFPAVDSPAKKLFQKNLEKGIAALLKKAKATAELTEKNVQDWVGIVTAYEDLFARLSHIGCYIGCLNAADARNETYQEESGKIALMSAELAKMEVEILRAFKKTPEKAFQKLLKSEALAGASHYLKRLRTEAKSTMHPEMEALAADLGVDGIHAWARLYDRISGKMEFSMRFPDGTTKMIPMSQRRSLMEDADRRIRQEAFESGNKVWETFADVCGASLNHIAGFRLTLNRQRGNRHFLDVALLQSAISRKTLDAMFQAVRACQDIPQRIIKAKARLLGLQKLSWFDFDAPLPSEAGDRLTWTQGKKMVEQAFDREFPKLADFLRLALAKNWVESELRPGKRPGAFCTDSYLNKESRVFMSFNGSLGDIQTLAHEIGHAYHNSVMEDHRPFAHTYPMTLAESASTFAELILSNGILADPKTSPAWRAEVLNQNLANVVAFLMNIPVRFEFEKNFYEERQKGEVPLARIKDLMVKAQQKVFGNTLAKGGEDSLFWASKLHFYLSEISFYNFPYTFGFLLSRGLFARFRQEGPKFLERYDAFLKMTGSETAENVAKQTLGIDLEKPKFWMDSIQILEDEVCMFENLASQKGKDKSK